MIGPRRGVLLAVTWIALLASLPVAEIAHDWRLSLTNLRQLKYGHAVGQPLESHGCRALVASRLVDVELPHLAEAQWLASETCARPTLRFLVGGVLAWERGETDLAIARWGEIDDRRLLHYGRAQLAEARQDIARVVLELVVDRNEANSNLFAAASAALGDLARGQRDWTSALRNYLAAWEAGNRAPDVALYLGMSYQRLEQHERTVRVMRSYDDPRGRSRSRFWADYDVLLARSLEATGRVEEAEQRYRAAADLYRQVGVSLPPFLERRLQMFDDTTQHEHGLRGINHDSRRQRQKQPHQDHHTGRVSYDA